MELGVGKFTYQGLDVLKDGAGLKVCIGRRTVLIDCDQIDLLVKYYWRLTSHGYAVLTPRTGRGRSGQVYLHRLLLDAKNYPDKVVDHINRDPSDNRICNLRLVSHSENSLNRGVSRSNKTGIKHCYFRTLKSGIKRYVVEVKTKTGRVTQICKTAGEAELWSKALDDWRAYYAIKG